MPKCVTRWDHLFRHILSRSYLPDKFDKGRFEPGYHGYIANVVTIRPRTMFGGRRWLLNKLKCAGVDVSDRDWLDALADVCAQKTTRRP